MRVVLVELAYTSRKFLPSPLIPCNGAVPAIETGEYAVELVVSGPNLDSKRLCFC